MLRLIIAAPFGLVIAGVFFVLLAQMVQMEQIRELPDQDTTLLNLVPLPEESELALRRRDKPEPPEPQPEQPAMPNVPDPTPVVEHQLDTPVPDIDVPRVDIESSFQLSVDVSQFKPGEPTLSFAENPTPLSRVNPRYPRKAIRRGIEGEVVVEFTVSPDGSVLEESIRIISSKPEGVFDHSSIRALSRWRFQPRMQNGQPAPFLARQTLVFKLEK